MLMHFEGTRRVSTGTQLMDAIFHIGMHKTASSTIQHVFSTAEMEHPKYVKLKASGESNMFGTANHSGLLGALFHEPIEKYHSFKRRNLSREQLVQIRSQMKDTLREYAQGDGVCLFSAEYLSGTGIDFDAFAEFVSDCFDSVRIIGYVRSPVSYMHARFQQVLKAGTMTERSPENVMDAREWQPKYRKMFERFDLAFGRENVTLKPFLPEHLLNRDIIADFAQEIGYRGAVPENAEVNTSLSLEAAALLYLQRTRGSGGHSGYPQANNHNSYFVEMMRKVKGNKLKLAVDLRRAKMENLRKDVQWMEERLGVSIDDTQEIAASDLRTKDELREYGVQSIDSWQEVLVESVDFSSFNPSQRLKKLSVLKTFIESDEIIPDVYKPGRKIRPKDLRAPVTTEDESALKQDIMSALNLPNLGPRDRAIKLLETGKLLSELVSDQRRQFT